MNLIEDIKYQYNTGNVIFKLLFINIFSFIVFGMVHLCFYLINSPFSDQFNQWLSVPSNLHNLLYKPYTLITYQFLHNGFFHLLFNLLMLYYIGILFVDYYKQKEAWLVYLLGGVVGALLYVLCYNLFPVFKTEGYLIGASASIKAILFATACYAPQFKIRLFGLFEIKLLNLALALLILDFIMIPYGNAGGLIAHIGGAAFGWYYGKYKMGSLSIPTFFKSRPKREFKVEINNRNSTNKPLQSEIDAILDKISVSGYDRLSKEEKDKLFRASQD